MRSTLLLILALPTSATAVETATASWYAPLGVTLGLDASVGTGTFVSSSYADDPYYASTLSIEPSWALDESLRLSLRFAVNYEWTSIVTGCRAATGPRPVGAPAEDCSDVGNPNGHRADLDDLSLSLAHSGVDLPLGARLSGRASVALPTSRSSRAATNVLTAGLGAGLSLPIGDVTPSLGVGFSKHFTIDDAPLADAGEGALPLGRCRDPLRSSCLLLSGFAPSWRLGFDLGVEVLLPYGLDASISVGYSYSRRNGRAPDAFSSTRTDASGVRIVDGTSSGDSTNGGLELGFTPEELGEAWRFAFGVSSAQPARTEDGQSLRFPLFDFISPANNYSAWYLSASWTP